MAINTTIQKTHLQLRNESSRGKEILTFEIAPETTSQSLPSSFSSGVVPGDESIPQFQHLGSETISFNILINDQGAKFRVNNDFKTVPEMIQALRELRKPVRLGTQFPGSPPVLRLIYAADVNGLYFMSDLSITVLQRDHTALPIRATVSFLLTKFKRSSI